MIEGQDYYFLVHESKIGDHYKYNVTAIHCKTSIEGIATETDSKLAYAIALDRLKDELIERYVK